MELDWGTFWLAVIVLLLLAALTWYVNSISNKRRPKQLVTKVVTVEHVVVEKPKEEQPLEVVAVVTERESHDTFTVAFSLKFKSGELLEFTFPAKFNNQTGFYELDAQNMETILSAIYAHSIFPEADTGNYIWKQIANIVNQAATDKILEPYREGVGGHG